jgi:hypothetical protein
MITLDELAPAEWDDLEAFKFLLSDSFGNLEAAWKGLARKGQLRLTVDEFVDACQAIGWDRDPEQMHGFLDSHPHGGKHVTIKDLEWLDLPRASSGKKPFDCCRRCSSSC